MPKCEPAAPSSSSAAGEPLLRRPWQELLLLAALPLALYAGSLGFGFADPDDELYFRLNPALHGGVAQGAMDLWKAPYLHDYFPVTQTSIWLDLALFGPERLWGARLQALVWFILGVWAVRALVLRLTASRNLALAVAVLYAVHPVCGHAVMWLSERKNLVCFAILFWSFERYVAARQAETVRAALYGWAVAWVLGILALLSKPHAVALPVLLAAYELCLGRGAWWKRAGWVLPFVASNLVFLVLSLGAAQNRLEHYSLGGGPLGALANDGPILWRYLWHTVLPVDLSFFYYQPELSAVSPWGWGAWLALAALVGGCVLCTRDRRLMAFGWLASLAALSPALNLAPQQLTTLTDQYHQWALPAWLLVACLLIREGLTRWTGQARRWGTFLVAGAALYAGLLTLARLPDYVSMLTVSRANVVHEPDSALGWARYTRALAASDERELRAQALEAGYRALHCPDADRIQTLERALALTEALVWLRVKNRDAEADELLARVAPSFARVPLPFVELVRAQVALRTRHAPEAVELLAPRFDAEWTAVAARLRAERVAGGRSPNALPPFKPIVRDDLPAHEQMMYEDFERQWLRALVEACLKTGQFDRAGDAAAVLLNTAPADTVARQLWDEVVRRREKADRLDR
jgi:hypothetical protein